MKVSIWISLMFLVLASACSRFNGSQDSGSISDGTLTIFAAASLSEAFSEIAEEYRSLNPGSEVAINFAGSQQLAQQLSHGASVDVFASADYQQIDNVIKSGRVEGGTEQPFIHNQLAIVLPEDNPGGILEFKDLEKTGIQLIFADSAVPAGRYSQEMLDRASADVKFGVQFKGNVLENVVSYEENVRAVLTKIILGEADAGIVYLSDFIGASEENIKMVTIPDEVNVTASYLIAPLMDSGNKDHGMNFIQLVLSPNGQEILKLHGFNH
jgi:molybdate transport system substrate-binding protein